MTAAILPLAAAGVMTACSGRGQNDAASALHGDHPSGEAHPAVSLAGCLEPGDAAGQYRLQHVRIAPAAEQPTGSANSAQTGTITEGSWVRLTASDEDTLRANLGKEVSIVGTVTDDGRNTIGTSGYQKGAEEPESRTDKSAQAKDESYSAKMKEEAGPLGQQSNWNGFAPEIAVNRVASTGNQCSGQ
ncbi:MAG TPA: hypothetical protein VF147_10020 [Vicinamibacterales bacterium]